VQTYRVELTSEEYGRLNAEYPRSDSNSRIGKRAEEIVKIFFRRRNPRCAFEVPRSGADLKVVISPSESFLIEVKGTASAGLAPQQIKASSSHSRRMLAEEGVPIYRVSEVFAAVPLIYVLAYGVDYTLKEEARWAFQPIRRDAIRQPVIHADRDKPRAASNEGQMSKYEALRRYLENQGRQPVTLGFKEATTILGFRLPSSAYKHQAFWANQTDTTNRPQARAWQEAGYEVDACRLSDDGWVRFKPHRS
jgi:hypothetical protein